MSDIIYDPQVRINNDTIATVPNTIRMITGKGESLVKPQSSGNGQTTPVYSEDVETKIGKIFMSVYSTKEMIDKMISFKDNRADNYLLLNSNQGQFVLKNAALITDPELTLGNDGQAELEFHGSPIQ